MTQSHYQHLSERWRARQQSLQKKLWDKHKESLSWLSNNYRQLVTGSLGGLMLLTGQVSSTLNPPIVSAASPPIEKIDKKISLISDLAKLLVNASHDANGHLASESKNTDADGCVSQNHS